MGPVTAQSRMAPNGGDDVGRRSMDGRRPAWHRPLTPLIGLLLALFLAAPPVAAAFGLPGWGGARQGGAAPQKSASTPIQEVAPPGSVQQLRAGLGERRPRLAITAPADGALLPEGPWTLRLELEDWPLVDAGELGLGPHLQVQLDDQPAMAVTTTEVSMPSLAPGSHRLTAYAAWPWGEAVKDPGACRQIRLHRVAANPLALPAAGSPQLLLVSPAEPRQAEPVLLDWLLLDAPLQNLREGDDRWRLRVTLNGDSFLVDRQEPLWLKGWRRGGNALLMELVDPRGNPLNPPFNSLVREVIVAAGADDSPWWGVSRLNEEQLAVLLGRTPPAPPPPLEPPPRETAVEPEGPAGSAPSPTTEDADPAEPSGERPSATEPQREPRTGTELPGQNSAPSAPSTAEPGGDEPTGAEAASGRRQESEPQEEEQEDGVQESEPQEREQQEVSAASPAAAAPAPEATGP